MRELVEFIVTSLVDNKDCVNIDIHSEDEYYVINIKVAEEDIGRIIGKQGKIINAIRSIVNAKEENKKYKVFVK